MASKRPLSPPPPGTVVIPSVGPILDIDPPTMDTNRMGLMGRKKDKLSNKEPTNNPGITNTTHILLNSKMSSQVFSFPQISAEQQRRAGCTPRPEDQPYPRTNNRLTRSNSRSPQRGGAGPKARTSVVSLTTYNGGGSGEKAPGVGRAQSELMTAPPASSVVSDGDAVVKSEAAGHSTPRANSVGLKNGDSQASAGSFHTGPGRKSSRDRYSRMIALGLPKVNIDIDRNHFSRQSMKRRSQRIREAFEMNHDLEDMDQDMDMEINHRWSDDDKVETAEITKVSDTNRPNESVVDYDIGPSVSEVGVKGQHAPVTVEVKSSSHNTNNNIVARNGLRSSRSSGVGNTKPEAITVSYYKMSNPGKKDMHLVVEPPISSRFKHSYQATSDMSLNDPDRLHVHL